MNVERMNIMEKSQVKNAFLILHVMIGEKMTATNADEKGKYEVRDTKK